MLGSPLGIVPDVLIPVAMGTTHQGPQETMEVQAWQQGIKTASLAESEDW